MLFNEMISIAVQSIRTNLFRGFLTMLGIIIGVGSVITMVALGSGAQRAIDDQIDALGASILSVRAGSFMRHGVGSSQTTLSVDDAEALAADAKMISAFVPEVSRQLQTKYLNKNQNLRIVGSPPNFA